ncbi:MAG: hypothetical protein Q8916_07680 [Bacteroidota bacterium]|nr:hypothetical protein [Bacteroidota bacterium]MDP4230273.1 hypothetical protein [Bacteroidota bacterium]MDP4236119.1 hypothetical protein [Bacteroidota bacterium]
MATPMDFSQKVWIGAIGFIVGVLVGYFVLNPLIHSSVTGSGTISKFQRVIGNPDSGKIGFIVPSGDSSFITSHLIGPTNKAVRLVNTTTGAMVSTYTPAGRPYHTCATDSVVGWRVGPGSYQLYILYDNTGSTHCGTPPPTTTYLTDPSAFTGTVDLSTPTGIKTCPIDLYDFTVLVHGDETKITIIMEPGM